MDRSERHAFFDRVVALRAAYGADEDDRTAVLSIADAVRYGEAVMRALHLDNEPWLAGPDGLDDARADGARTTCPDPAHGRRFASDL